MKLHLSPRGLLVRALLIALAFEVVHALGWRDETRFLSGTPGSARLGILYVFLYFAFVLIAPALVLAGGVLAILERLTRPRGQR